MAESSTSPRRNLKHNKASAAQTAAAIAAQKDNPIVASLSQKSPPHPFSSIALSPNREYAVTARKDTLLILQVGSAGIHPHKEIPIAQHFQTKVSTSDVSGRSTIAGSGSNNGSSNGSSNNTGNNMGRIYEDVRDTFVRDAFGYGNRTGASQASSNNINVILTDVAWSKPIHANTGNGTGTGTGTGEKPPPTHSGDGNSGTHSNYSSISSSSSKKHHKNNHTTKHTGKGGQGQHKTADSTSTAKTTDSKDQNTVGTGTSLIAAAGSNGVIVVWTAETLLEGESGQFPAPDAILSQHVRAVNRLAWHPRRPGLLLSASQDGTVILWERQRSNNSADPQRRGQSKQSSKQGFSFFGGIKSSQSNQKRSYAWICRATFEPKSEAVRDIQWSPFHDDVFALVTSSGSLIAYNMNVKAKALLKITAHSGESTTLAWHPIQPNVVATGGASDRCVKVWDLESYLSMKKDDSNMASNVNTMTSVMTDTSAESGTSSYSYSHGSVPARITMSSQSTLNSSSRHTKASPKNMLHVLSISAAVTRLRWRPPAGDTLVLDDEDRHEAMLAVSTAPIKGASAGGSGLLALWSYHRPFMPLSVVEGHKDGAVTDFDWLDTPQPVQLVQASGTGGGSHQKQPASSDARQFRRQGSSHEVDAILYDNSELDGGVDRPVGIWQHTISVGRDGRCLMQSFARGDRPIKVVPPSCFAMANLSPFQKGYGSLQVFSVCQPVPSGPQNNFLLTGLRKDNVTARAPGVFREEPSEEGPEGFDSSFPNHLSSLKRLPTTVPQLMFNVLDQGNLDNQSTPKDEGQEGITIAPEVVHLSRFADNYVLYPDEQYLSRVALCRHNAGVASRLRCNSLAQMWTTVATMLESAGLDGLPQSGSQPSNVMQFVILPTIKSLLEERADAGDVQTCVALCEILEVVMTDEKVRVPGLDLTLIREWYLSYIDLLRDMCLFSTASFLIRSCKDPFISALNQQSTTIHESCPHCGKPLLQADGTAADRDSTARRACKSCRRRVGMCFICHQPVKGMYVWCPGCGHGGHLDHALQWFGGLSGKPVREVCPTGCGHKCNMLQPLSAFPRTESISQLVQFSDQIDMLPHAG